jgi:hypothetical protein
VRLVDAAKGVRRREEQAVVRPDEQAAVACPQGERPAMASDPRVDDREMDADRHVRKRVAENKRALQHLLWRDPVGDVDDLRLGRDPLHHAMARTDEVVLQPEVGEKGDHHGSGA